MASDYPDLAPHLTELHDDHRTNPIGDLVTISCDPWHHGDRTVVIGDAAHAIVPFYGQGANAALEDCLLLVDALNAGPRDRGRALTRFTETRRPDTEALSALTLANFVEMRDHVDSPRFAARGRLERFLSERLGSRFQTRYQMVTFSRMPYAEAQRTAERNERVIDAILGGGALGAGAAALGITSSMARSARMAACLPRKHQSRVPRWS